VADKVSQEAKIAQSAPKSQIIPAVKSNIDGKRYEVHDELKRSSLEELGHERFNPLALRFKQLHFSSHEGVDKIRSQARRYEKIARIQLWRVKNRGRGDTAVNGMIFASRQLLNVSRRILTKAVTPKLVYEFRYAKAEFEKAKKMSVAQATKLPYVYQKEEIRRRLEEEEDRVIPVIHEEDDYTKFSKTKPKLI
jgi:hypothetical protein